jgi:hypothetical protein
MILDGIDMTKLKRVPRYERSSESNREKVAGQVIRRELVRNLVVPAALSNLPEDKEALKARCSVRQARAKPLLDDLRHWMEKTVASLSAKSETAGAIRYALSRWRALTRYVDDG